MTNDENRPQSVSNDMNMETTGEQKPVAPEDLDQNTIQLLANRAGMIENQIVIKQAEVNGLQATLQQLGSVIQHWQKAREDEQANSTNV